MTGVTSMAGLALRLAVGVGRESLLRWLVTAVGVALGVTMLLFAAVAFPAVHAHDVRSAWLTSSPHNARPAQDETHTDPLLFRADTTNFADRTITVVDVAALGPRAPVPPGLARLPGPGEYAVSPAMARLLATTPADLLADRFPGRAVATIGDRALAGPDQLMVILGHDPAALHALTNVAQVRSIETAPVRHGYSGFLRVVLAIAVLALILPVVVFVSTATRLGAARREQRLAALRLIGASSGQLGILAAAEAAVAAIAGTVLGFLAFAAAHPFAARIPLDGTTFFPTDLRLPPLSRALIAVGVPCLAVAVADLSLRRARISPLGVTRQAPAPASTWRRLMPLAAGVVGVIAALPVAATRRGTAPLVALCLAFTLVVVGITIAGPWLTVMAGTVLRRCSRGFAGLLAARRLEANPAAAFRSISGLILAVFVASLICGALPSALQANPQGKFTMPAASVLAQFGGEQATGLNPAEAATLTSRLAGSPGVTRVIGIRRAPQGWTLPVPDSGPREPVTVVLRCDELRMASALSCPDPAATVALDIHQLDAVRGSLLPLVHPIPATTLDQLPLAGIVVLTDGRTTAVERVRTAIYHRIPMERNYWVTTTDDQDAVLKHRLTQIEHLATLALLLTLLVAGCAHATSIAGGLIERRRPLALLHLAGAHPADLRRIVLAETAVPLVNVAVISAGLGLALAAALLHAGRFRWLPPDAYYWVTLGGGLVLALVLTLASARPLLTRLTAAEGARAE